MTYESVNNDYNEFIEKILEGADSTIWDDVIRNIAPENVHVGRNLQRGEKWLRSRRHKSIEEEPFIQGRIGMNKINPDQGRFNQKGESLFYLSKDRDTTFEEIGLKEKDVVSVGHFIMKEEKKVIDLTGTIWSDNNKRYGKYTSPEANYFLLLIVENHLKAQSNDNIYAVTNYISRLLRSSGVDGIRYRSTHWENSPKWINVALVDDRQIEWKYTEQYQVIKKDSQNHTFTCKLLKRVNS